MVFRLFVGVFFFSVVECFECIVECFGVFESILSECDCVLRVFRGFRTVLGVS